MSTTDATPEPDHFVFDDFARRHLREWFAYGSAPNDWDLGVLECFAAWVEEHQEEWPTTASWPDMAKVYDLETFPTVR